MTGGDGLDVERELRPALAEHVADLPHPRIDLPAIRRRTAVRRRLLLSAVIALIGLATVVPIALGQGGAHPSRPGGSGTNGGAVTTPTTRPPGGTPGGTGQRGPQGSGATRDRSHPGAPAGQAQPPGAPAGCRTLPGPLPAAERARLLDDATTTLQQAQGTVDGALGGLERFSFPPASLARLLPAAGAITTLVDCGGRTVLAPAQRAAVLGEVRAAVLSSGAIAASVLDQTVGKLGLAAAAVPVTAAVTGTTSDSVVLTDAYGAVGGLASLGTVAVTLRRADHAVTKVDMTGLDLGVLGPVAVTLLHDLDPLAGLARLPGSVPVVVAPDATVVPPR
jgi:hypothetical protein